MIIIFYMNIWNVLKKCFAICVLGFGTHIS